MSAMSEESVSGLTVYTAHWGRYDDFAFVGVFSTMNRALVAAQECARIQWLERLWTFHDEPDYLLEIFKEGPDGGGACTHIIDE